MSIRKTKKRLKKQIDRLYLDKFSAPLLAKDLWESIYIYDSIQHHIERLGQELQQLKRKKDDGKRSNRGS